DVEARFAHLLQPIRDLTKNWEVDVAAQLGEYLEEVEYLYSLVYQALDFISGKKRAKQLSCEREDGPIGDAGSRAPQEVEYEFLSLDDLSDSRANVDLRSDQAPSETLIVPLLPMALVAPDETEKNSNPLYRGAFMLEPVGMSPMGALLPRNQKGEGSDVGGKEGAFCGGSGADPVQSPAGRAEEQPMEVSACRSPVPALSISQEPGTTPEGPVPGGGGEEEDTEGAAEPPEASAPEVPMEPQEPRSPEQSAAQPGRCALRERREALEPASRLKNWTSLLQPQGTSLPMSLDWGEGRPYSVPPCVEEAPGQKHADHADSRRPRRKGPSFAGEAGALWALLRDDGTMLCHLPSAWVDSGGPGKDEGALLTRLSCADMEVLYWRHAAERWRPRAQEEPWPAEEERLEDSLEDVGAAGDFLEPEEYAEPEGAEPGEDADLEAEAMPASLSYEELELFIATSQKFVQETELSQRVRDWEDVIQPLLQEQEQHVPFDIHTYGDQVVSRFSQLNQWCPFAELVAGQPAFEVCRSMLASLQLANDYTVEITQQPGLEAAVDTMSLRLLTYQRAHKRFQTYAAPSMVQP
ncbi:hypothetical protein E2I00_004713, partial [Balaenoptera physalus]